MIQKSKEWYKVMPESGRNMGTYKTLKEARKRLSQIEYFKRKREWEHSNETKKSCKKNHKKGNS